METKTLNLQQIEDIAFRALVAAGTAQAQVYQAMTRNGLTAPAAAPAAAAKQERPAQRQPDPAAVANHAQDHRRDKQFKDGEFLCNRGLPEVDRSIEQE